MASIFIVPNDIAMLSIEVDDQVIEIDLTGATGGAEVPAPAKPPAQPSPPAEPRPSPEAKPPEGIPAFPPISTFLAQLGQKYARAGVGSDVLQTLHLSLATSRSGLSEVVAALEKAPVPEGARHHVVIRHAADTPFKLSELIHRLQGSPDTLEVTILVTPPDA